MTTSIEELPWDIKAAPTDVQAHYRRMIAAGVQPRAAEMFALQQPPGVKGTDRTLMQGRYNNEQFDQMPPDQAKKMLADARKAGINPNGKYYCSGLADKRGAADPGAWIDSVAEVKKVAAMRNLTVTGAVQHQGIPQPRPESQPLSQRLTREMMRVEKKLHPTMKKGELRELVISKYGRKRKGR
jgi:hypothetical protein